MDYAPFEEGTRPLGPAFELLGGEPESPFPGWNPGEYEEARLIVAHQDDEIIFAGGLMLAYPNWKWEVITVTDTGRDFEQAQVFEQMGRWGVKVEAINLGFADAWLPQVGYRRDILDALRGLGGEPDITFTHGYRGEYGHHAHVWTHHAVHMTHSNVWDFLHPCSRVKQLRKTLVREVDVDARKRNIFNNSYGHTASNLRMFAPWITDRLDACKPEYFTQAVVGI